MTENRRGWKWIAGCVWLTCMLNIWAATTARVEAYHACYNEHADCCSWGCLVAYCATDCSGWLIACEAAAVSYCIQGYEPGEERENCFVTMQAYCAGALAVCEYECVDGYAESESDCGSNGLC